MFPVIHPHTGVVNNDSFWMFQIETPMQSLIGLKLVFLCCILVIEIPSEILLKIDEVYDRINHEPLLSLIISIPILLYCRLCMLFYYTMIHLLTNKTLKMCVVFCSMSSFYQGNSFWANTFEDNEVQLPPPPHINE